MKKIKIISWLILAIYLILGYLYKKNPEYLPEQFDVFWWQIFHYYELVIIVLISLSALWYYYRQKNAGDEWRKFDPAEYIIRCKGDPHKIAKVLDVVFLYRNRFNSTKVGRYQDFINNKGGICSDFSFYLLDIFKRAGFPPAAKVYVYYYNGSQGSSGFHAITVWQHISPQNPTHQWASISTAGEERMGGVRYKVTHVMTGIEEGDVLPGQINGVFEISKFTERPIKHFNMADLNKRAVKLKKTKPKRKFSLGWAWTLVIIIVIFLFLSNNIR